MENYRGTKSNETPVRLGHLRGYIPEQPDLIDFSTFAFKKWSSLDLGINKLTKPLLSADITSAYLYFCPLLHPLPPGISWLYYA